MDTPDLPAFEPTVFSLPFPADFADEKDEDVLARASAVCEASVAIHANAIQSGQQITITQDDQIAAYQASDDTRAIAAIERTATALHLTAILSEYDHAVVQNASQIRNLCTNLLLDKAVNGKTDSAQLRAVEMLGKIKDVALFEERSSVLVEHMTTDELKKSLRQKIADMRSNITDVTPRPVPTDPTPDTP